ncbi:MULTISPECIES: DUF6572 domain-containing protein [unclassified Pseudomonas]|uniref:DUF6572 domain-containing protein n=1 Tax=unclassified Pseudomonas TaxID=196821 RepID=UPI00128D4A03|nr:MULTISPECIES: DUF6572 domain-containing protein [unclassified Pseudomonas]MPQ71794.1 hypothetical protein [Pseudomonas sp. MWU12-2323]
MTVEQIGVIDAIGVDKETGELVLTIADHLEWDDEHLLLLQEKLNLYIGFFESGELLEVYPDSKGRQVSIILMCKYLPDARAKSFLNKVGSIVEQAGAKFTFKASNMS